MPVVLEQALPSRDVLVEGCRDNWGQQGLKGEGERFGNKTLKSYVPQSYVSV